jgi:hypothetical protein
MCGKGRTTDELMRVEIMRAYWKVRKGSSEQAPADLTACLGAQDTAQVYSSNCLSPETEIEIAFDIPM